MTTVTNSDAASTQTVLPLDWSLADLQQHLGDVASERIRLFPLPGTATVQNALELDDREDRLFEVIDGVLVEKVMGAYEAILAGILVTWINNFLAEHPTGVAWGADGMLRIQPAKMRIPDVCYVGWDRFPGRKLLSDRVYRVAPDLAVEILSAGNTQAEMEKKLAEYFEAGVRLVWYIDPRLRQAYVYTAVDNQETSSENDTIDGGQVLPGFEFRLADLFERAERGAGD